MNSLTKISVEEFLLYFTIAISILWDPIRHFLIPTDGAGRTVIVCSLVTLCNRKYFSTTINILKYPSLIIWTILVLYSLINSLYKGFWGANENMTLWGLLRALYFRPFIFLTLLIVGLRENRVKCLYVILIASFLYLCWGALNLHSWSVDSERQMSSLGNSLPLFAVTSFFIAGVMYLNGLLKRELFLFICLLCVFVIFSSGTRKAFGAGVIILIGVVLDKSGKFSFLQILRLCLISYVLYFGISFVIENSLIGARIIHSEKYNVQLVENEWLNKFLMLFLGDRSNMYLQGIEVFRDSPITGIGHMNFLYYYSGATHVLHTEYIAQLAENGLIGLVLLMWYYFVLFCEIVRKQKQIGVFRTIYLFALISILFINFTAWTYCASYVMIIYACLLDFVYSEG